MKNLKAIAYVDGSYNTVTNCYGYGIVFNPGDSFNEIRISSDPFKNSYSVHRNVAGEVFGALKAVEIAIESGYSSIELNFDYSGIEMWATNKWSANNEMTQMYKDKMEKYRKEIKITFNKIKSHSNDKYNDIADLLAKKAIGAKNH